MYSDFFELDGRISETQIANDKIHFIAGNLLELTDESEYSNMPEGIKPLYFWNNRQKILSFVEMILDYSLQAEEKLKAASEIQERMVKAKAV